MYPVCRSNASQHQTVALQMLQLQLHGYANAGHASCLYGIDIRRGLCSSEALLTHKKEVHTSGFSL